MSEKIRMNNPEDTFMKRQFTYLGAVAHEFYNLPGKYLGSECNEYPNAGGGIPRADIVYHVEMEDGRKFVINVEDETNNVNMDTLKKVYNYKSNIYYKTRYPVISVITTTLPRDRCLGELWFSSTDLLRPKIISFPDENAWKRLNSMLDKAKKQEEFSDVEGLELINLPRCCTKDHEKAIELICEELLNLNIEDSYVKNELIYAMQCMIHKYARTDEDILRLEGMIELRQVIDKRSPVLDAMKYEGRKEGRKEGIEIGREEERNDTLKVLCGLVKSSPVDSTMEKVIGSLGFSMDEVMNADID